MQEERGGKGHRLPVYVQRETTAQQMPLSEEPRLLFQEIFQGQNSTPEGDSIVIFSVIINQLVCKHCMFNTGPQFPSARWENSISSV